MKKVKVLFIKFLGDRYGYGLSDYELKTFKSAHQCDLVVGITVTQPIEDIEYPYFEIKQFEVKEQSFVDTYENEIESLKELVKDRDREITNLKYHNTTKVDKKYKVMFYTFLILFFFMSMMLYFKL